VRAAGTDLTLRPALAADAAPLAELFLAARERAYPAMPRPVHSPPQVRRWFHQLVAPDRETWVAEVGGEVAGYLLLDADWLDSLYVRPDLTGQGMGSVLLDLAKGLRAAGFGLWVFESNQAARRFYRRHGLVEVRRTDGSGNEEGEPDVEMAWPGAHPA
jgi:GNAT superfamily N-acetyltransferase